MINFEYKGNIYRIKKSSSINSLLAREELLQLPLSAWQELLKMKDGICPSSMLFNILRIKIEQYDKSSAINNFTLKGINYWFDKTTRVSLAHLVNSCEGNVQFVLGKDIVNLTKEEAQDFLAQLEVYAQKCFIVTHQHLENVNQLQTVEDLINYEYTKQYPSKINFI